MRYATTFIVALGLALVPVSASAESYLTACESDHLKNVGIMCLDEMGHTVKPIEVGGTQVDPIVTSAGIGFRSNHSGTWGLYRMDLGTPVGVYTGSAIEHGSRFMTGSGNVWAWVEQQGQKLAPDKIVAFEQPQPNGGNVYLEGHTAFVDIHAEQYDWQQASLAWQQQGVGRSDWDIVYTGPDVPAGPLEIANEPFVDELHPAVQEGVVVYEVQIPERTPEVVFYDVASASITNGYEGAWPDVGLKLAVFEQAGMLLISDLQGELRADIQIPECQLSRPRISDDDRVVAYTARCTGEDWPLLMVTLLDAEEGAPIDHFGVAYLQTASGSDAPTQYDVDTDRVVFSTWVGPDATEFDVHWSPLP